jgi:hypothetical protein
MNKLLTPLAILLMMAITLSCGGNKKTKSPVTTEEPVSTDTTFLFDRLTSAGSPRMLSEQRLTSEDALLRAFDGDPEDFHIESTPADAAFYFPESSLCTDPLVRQVMLHNNYVSVFYRVLHGYELFHRATTGTDEEDLTREDTLYFIKIAQPHLSPAAMKRAIQDADALDGARGLLAAFRTFEGDDSESSPFSLAMDDYSGSYEDLPGFVSTEEKEAFAQDFWGWYDKRKAEPLIDELVRTHLNGGSAVLDSLERERFKRVIMGESNIDRRAVLALEMAQVDRREGVLLLGDIIESGIYTKYLLEVWISWRANAQMEHSPSSFSRIPNNYYDRMRAKCLDTFLRHTLEDSHKDENMKEEMYVRCLIQNMILAEIIHRMGSIAGNTSFNTCMHLAHDMFIDPRLLEEKK